MEMDGTAKEIFIAAQNHLSVAKASGDLDRLAEKAKSATDSPIGTNLASAPSYAGNASGHYYYVIHNVNSGTEHCMPAGSDAILEMMLPFGALDETVSAGGNYAIVYELDSASVVAVLYSGAGNASFGNAAVINFGDDDVSKIKDICNDKSARKNYVKNGVTAIVGCYTGKAGSAAIPTETLEAPKLEVKNKNKLHVLVHEANNTDNITLVITGEQSGTTARRLLTRNAEDGYASGTGAFDVTLDDITGDGKYRFSQLISGGRFTPDVDESNFIPGENIIISAIASSSTALATPKESAKYTVSSLFDDVNETTNSNGDTKVYIKNLRHLENLGANVSGFTAALRKDTTSNSFKVVNITAEQKNDITMFSFDKLHDGQHIYGSETFASTYIAANVDYPLSYDGGSHEIYDLSIAPYSGRSATELNAGIFGNVTDKLSVKNLILRNDKILEKASATNAGMLLGKTSADLTVDGVLAYYYEETYNADNDSNVEVVAIADKGVAGGLIGFVSDGMLNVKNSAAAVYVKGGSAAGGLIGSVSGADAGSTIVQSYTGGHTKDGAYSTTDATTNKPVLTGAGRYNVQATQASGYAGGFIGVTTDNVRMDAVYSTASAYSPSGEAYSNSFAGSGTPNIQATADGKKNYYAIGTHNGKDADGEDIEKAQITEGQNSRQATAYDRTLMGATETAAHPVMDKTSYPLNTVRHLCAASVDDKDLPWFIKEHVGDWAMQKTGESKFEVDNGNRLTVRIDTGMNQIAGDLYYEIKVHGVSSNKDKYFLLHVKNTAGDFTLVRADNIIKTTSDSYMNQQNICKIVPAKPGNGTTIQTIEFYLDDITNPRGNFKSVCEGLTPGENIKISVAPAKVTGNIVSVKFDEKTAIETNSLFGYLKTSDASDVHNENKIAAVQPYYSDAGNTALGLVPYNNTLYAQIDNARHLENLSPEISGYTDEIKGAIQTDNIYWSYESNPSLVTGPDSYTKIFTKELGSDLNVYDQDGNKHNNAAGCFRPFNSNTKIELYSAWDEKNKQNYKISGVRVNEENGMAGIFAHTPVAITIQNLDIENGSFTSKSDKAGGLIAYGENTVTFNSVNFTGDLTVKGQNIAGGFVAQSKESLNITKSSIKNASIHSDTDKAGGLAGYTESDVTISETHITGDLTVKGQNIAGGFVAQPKGSLNITKSSINNASIHSDTDKAGGLAGFTDNDVTISEMDIAGTLTVEAKNIAGGFVAQPTEALTVKKSRILNATIISNETDAGGLIGEAKGIVELRTIKLLDTTVQGYDCTGGYVGNADNNVGITLSDKTGTESNSRSNQNLIKGCTITSVNSSAGGLVGKAESKMDADSVVYEGNNTIKGSAATGGAVGKTGNGEQKFQNFEFAGVMNVSTNAAKEAVGGLIGYSGGITSVKNVKVTGKLFVSGTGSTTDNSGIHNAAGGVIGYVLASATLDDFTLGENAEMMVTSTDFQAGGLIGIANATTKINQVVNDKAIISGKLTVSGAKECGGLVGTGSSITISNVEAATKAEMKVISTHGQAGGWIGKANALTIQNCYNRGKLTVYANQEAGGMVGGALRNTTIMNSSIEQAKISSDMADAGGVIGNGDTDKLEIKNVKVISNTTEIIASKSTQGNGNVGGLVGSLTVNTSLNIDNTAVSAFVRSSSNNGNAGGLMGEFTSNSNTESTISKSYYGGRTTNAAVTGPYSTITLTDENSTFSDGSNRTYTSNISAHNNVGGIIGYMQANGNVTIANCFSTGSVGNDSRNAIAGFIGKMYCFANVRIDYAYSMGTVAGNGGHNGGFIGEMIGPHANFGSHVYYLDFLRSGKNAIGYTTSTTSGDVQKLTSDYKILEVESEGTNTQQTVYYDATLFGQYPYKNWMTDWEADGNPITYYGDWPQQLNGKFVYYRSLDNNYENGGMFAITGYGTSFSSNIVKQTTGVKLDEAGFGILCEAIDRKMAKNLYNWSSSPNGTYQTMSIDGSDKAPEYSVVNIGVKKYYFFRISKDEIENIANERSQNNTFYIKDSAGAKYEIVVQDQKATFNIIP